MIYRCLRSLLFLFEPERAHNIALNVLNCLARLKLGFLFRKPKLQPVELMGLKFANRVGLAAGLDKNAKFLPGLSQLGFGFIEIGSVPPKPQPGNPKPRLFRLTKHEALINRFGFNSEGMEKVLSRLQKRRYQGVLGISITQNNETDYHHSVNDYLHCFKRVYAYADFISVNISCPNVRIERSFQEVEHLTELVMTLKQAQQTLHKQTQKYVPILIKLSPDIDEDDLATITQILIKFKIDGVISCNTSKQRTGVTAHPLAKEPGGLSGAPIFAKSVRQIKLLRSLLGKDFPIIAVGGITSANKALQMFRAGADLIQIYTGLIYHGPKLIREIVEISPNRLDV